MDEYVVIYFSTKYPIEEAYNTIELEAEDSLDAREKSWKIAMDKIRAGEKYWITAKVIGVMTKEEFANEYANK